MQRLRFARLIAAVSVIGLAPIHAHAGPFDWPDGRSFGGGSDDFDQPKQVNWSLAIGVGPYLPRIDHEPGGRPGPYQQMFGTDPTWIPMVSFERVLLRRLGGQWLVGISGGYLQTSADAWAICTVDGKLPPGCDETPGDAHRTRSTYSNTFHLIPLALTGSYRYTYLDDHYGLPIVPYARMGLSDYSWWVHDASTHVTSYMSGSPSSSSAGLQGTVGVYVRAERIDPDSARSMRDSGIAHAGFFFEGTAAWVDGFGQAGKLDVGDITWFAGVDFEF
jgi:hypothetical protein